MTVSLLPPNATPLSTALESILALDDRLPAPEVVASAKADALPPLVPWLIWEYSLGEVMPYLNDPQRALRDGVAWQRLRGTPAALTTALGWRGFEGAVIEENGPGRNFPWFQLDPRRLPNGTDIADIVALANLSKPARSRLIRLYHGLDRRPFHLSRDHLSGGALLSGWSGVWDEALQVWVSLGRRECTEADAGTVALATGAAIGASSAVTMVQGGFRLSDSKLSITTFQRPVEATGKAKAVSETTHDGVPFAGAAQTRRAPRSHVRLSGTRFSSLDHRFAGYTLESFPVHLSRDGLSRSRSAVYRHPIYGVEAVRLPGSIATSVPPVPSFGGGTLMTLTADCRPEAPATAPRVTPMGSAAAYTDALWTDAAWPDAPWPTGPITIGTAWRS